MNGIITIKEAGAILERSPTRVLQLIHKGEIQATRHGREYLVNRASVMARARKPPKRGRPKKGKGDGR